MADKIFKQVQTLQNKIDTNTKKIDAITLKVKELSKKGASRTQLLELFKHRKTLSQQNADLDNQILPLMQADVNVMTMKNAKLQKNLSNDPEANPYYYSRKEKDPKYADIAKKRTSMRMRGKNPGPWTSNLMSQELRSFEMEDGADPTLAAVAKQMGQRKKSKKSKKSKKPVKSSKPKGKSRRNMSRRRRR